MIFFSELEKCIFGKKSEGVIHHDGNFDGTKTHFVMETGLRISFAAAAVIKLSGDSALLIILVHLPYSRPYEVSLDGMERLIDSVFRSSHRRFIQMNTLFLFGSWEMSTFVNWLEPNAQLQ